MSNPTVPLASTLKLAAELQKQFEAEYAYHLVLAGWSKAINEAATSAGLPESGRRIIVSGLLSSLPETARRHATDNIVALGSRWLRLSEQDPDSPLTELTLAGLSELVSSTVVEAGRLVEATFAARTALSGRAS
jgi:hypothetical protein